jgi:hypothetical protein
MNSSLHSLIPFLPFLLSHLRLPSQETPSQSQSQSHIATDGQSVSKFWYRAPSGAHDLIFITVWQLRSCFFVGRPLWREDGSVSYKCCWLLPAQSFLGPSPFGLATIFYCLRFETYLFVTSYDSQGYGRGLKRLPQFYARYYSLGAYATENTVSIVIAQKYLDWCLRNRCRGKLFTESLPSNENLLWLCYSGFQASCHNTNNYYYNYATEL